MTSAMPSPNATTRTNPKASRPAAIEPSRISSALVLARGRLDRFDAGSPLGRASGFVPLAAACLVLALGLYLTVQAIGGGTTF